MAHTFTISGVFKEARAIIKPKLWTVIRQYLAITIIFAFLGALASQNILMSVLVNILGSFVLTVFSLGYAEHGGFSYHAFIKTITFPKFAYYFLGVMVMGIFVGLGFILLVVPGILLALRFSMVKFIVAQKEVGPLQACRESAKLTEDSRGKIFGFAIAAFFFNLLGLLCLGVGVFYTIPVTRIAMAVIYKKLREAKDFEPEIVEVVEVDVVESAPAAETV